MLNMLQINEAIKDIGPLLPLINQPPLKEVGIMTNQTIAEMFQSGNLKDIPGYEGLYAASRDGRIWSYPKWGSSKNGLWLKQQKYTNSKDRVKPRSHYNVPLRKNGKRSLLQVHRLIGLTYIPNPDNLPQINHQNCNPLINDVDNLEWSDGFGNMQHAQENGLIPQHTEKQTKTRSQNGKKTGAINGMKSRRMFTMTEADCIRKIHRITKKSYRSIA